MRKTFIPAGFSMAQCEYAWTSFDSNAKVFDWHKNREEDEKYRWHPTQKPKSLYRWLLANYAKKGDRILDTHLGSGNSRQVAYESGFEFVGVELNEEYFKKGVEDFERSAEHLILF